MPIKGDTKISNGRTYIYTKYGRWELDLGNQGDAFTYNDFTEEQINDLKVSGAQFATKQTGVDAGTAGDFFVDDDYMYICVTTGDASTAVWKKAPLRIT